MNPSSNASGQQRSDDGQAQAPRRRIYSTAYKLGVLKETMAPGASVSVIARRHNMNANVIFRWRREHQLGVLINDGPLKSAPPADEQFVAVAVVDSSGVVAMLPPPERRSADADAKAAEPATADKLPCQMELVLPNGIRVYVDPQVDASALRRLLVVAKELP